MRNFIISLFIVILLFVLYYRYNLNPEQIEYAKVKSVIDGDTIVLEDGRTVRYIGIDTPEKDSSYTKYECYSKQAHEKNSELVLNKDIKLVADIEKNDRYDRYLYYIYTMDDLFINEELVKGGYAESKAYPPNLAKQYILDKAEEFAKKNSIGLWNCIQ